MSTLSPHRPLLTNHNTPTQAAYVRIGIYGPDNTKHGPTHGGRLWAAGCAASIATAEGDPLHLPGAYGRSWGEVLEDVDGLVLSGSDCAPGPVQREDELLCRWCRDNRLPLLAIDHGLHLLNSALGGTTHWNLPQNCPNAEQHNHRIEPGARHMARLALAGKLLRSVYAADDEIIVNSEHSRAVDRVAPGLRVAAQAADGVIEALESADPETWFVLGVQWQPACSISSGLDIQLFRGLIAAARARHCQRLATSVVPAAPVL